MKTETPTKTRVAGFLPIYLESLRTGSVPKFDLYRGGSGEPVLFRSAAEPFTDKVRESLLENGVSVMFVPKSMQKQYHRYLESHVADILADKSVDGRTKANIVYDCCYHLVKDIMEQPTMGENIKRGQVLIESTVTHILCDETAFANMLRVMSFDYSTYTHSVNVCTFALALARFSGIEDEETLNQIGTGALLHDVGKTRVPAEIINKRDSLEEHEFDLIMKHPRWGWEIMHETNVLAEASYFPILQHHERLDGSGYPDGLTENEIHPFSKIVAIADVFDAMTTQRVYRNAVETFPALMVMYGDTNKFDKSLLELFTRLMGPAGLIDD